jgi:hypothetical protein
VSPSLQVEAGRKSVSISILSSFISSFPYFLSEVKAFRLIYFKKGWYSKTKDKKCNFLCKLLERLTANAKVATVLRSIPAS